MKQIFFSTACIALLFSCSGGNKKIETGDIDSNPATAENPVVTNNGPKGTPKFEELIHNFGKIKDGETVKHTFRFKNTGKGDLTVSDVKATCGCTTPNWTREVIPPGGEGVIDATFNSTGKGDPSGGLVEKAITVYFANSSEEVVELRFQSNIFSEPGENEPMMHQEHK